MRMLILTGLGLLASGCSLVKLTPQGENVAVLTMEQVANCMQVAETTVSVPDRLVIQRTPERVDQELRILARNSAASRGGDTVVPTSVVRDGQQNFNVYRCRR